jgi:hypothetical protein
VAWPQWQGSQEIGIRIFGAGKRPSDVYAGALQRPDTLNKLFALGNVTVAILEHRIPGYTLIANHFSGSSQQTLPSKVFENKRQKHH